MKVIFFTGAGISAESGIKTFRDSDGLWENHKVEEICNAQTWRKNKEKVFKFYSERRIQLGEVQPNHIHNTIAEIQHILGKDNVIIMTQNVDNLLERAGCKDVLHLHGFLPEMKCVGTYKCNHIWNVGYTETAPDMVCPKCGGESKPNIVFFGDEALNYHFMKQHFRSAYEEDIIVVMGTMGNVVAIDRYMDFTYGTKILNNLEKSDYINGKKYDHVFYEKGTTAIDKIKEIILKENERINSFSK
jgi:NAD-dependent deacetylase